MVPNHQPDQIPSILDTIYISWISGWFILENPTFMVYWIPVLVGSLSNATDINWTWLPWAQSLVHVTEALSSSFTGTARAPTCSANNLGVTRDAKSSKTMQMPILTKFHGISCNFMVFYYEQLGFHRDFMDFTMKKRDGRQDFMRFKG